MKTETRTCPQATRATSFIAIALVMLAGCATPPRQAITLDAGAFSQRLPAIYVMPVIDGRIDKSARLDQPDFTRIRKMAEHQLEGLGYQVMLVDSWGTNVPDQTLADMNDAGLAALAPSEAKVFLVITINDVHDKYKFITASYSITGTAMAIDRLKKTEIWKDAAAGNSSGGGVLDAAFSEIQKQKNSQQMLLRQVFASFPRNKP
jgi:hypothetical protein